MSGSQFAQQQVTTNFQAWLPAQGLPPQTEQSGSQWATSAFQFGAPIAPNANSTVSMENILLAWQPVVPQPTVPSDWTTTPNGGAGPTFGIFLTSALVHSEILLSWIPPNPLPTLPAFQYHKQFTPPAPPGPPAPVPGNLANVPHGVAPNGAVPVYITTNSATNGAVPRAGTANALVSGGQAVVVAVGPINGGYITNPTNATAQGIVTAENINVDLTGPPLAGDVYGFGTTAVISAGQTFSLPPLAAGVQVWVNAVTGGHKLTVVVW